MHYVMNATVKMERNGSDVPAAAGFTKSVYKTFTLMVTIKSDFVYSVTTNSHYNFLPFFLVVCK